MSEPYRVGKSYGLHVYQGDRPVATFHDSAEAQTVVDIVNAANAARTETVTYDGFGAPIVRDGGGAT